MWPHSLRCANIVISICKFVLVRVGSLSVHMVCPMLNDAMPEQLFISKALLRPNILQKAIYFCICIYFAVKADCCKIIASKLSWRHNYSNYAESNFLEFKWTVVCSLSTLRINNSAVTGRQLLVKSWQSNSSTSTTFSFPFFTSGSKIDTYQVSMWHRQTAGFWDWGFWL